MPTHNYSMQRMRARGQLEEGVRLGKVATMSFFGGLPIEALGFFTLRGHSLLEAWHVCSPRTADASARGNGLL
jgi:hypothetical protein